MIRRIKAAAMTTLLMLALLLPCVTVSADTGFVIDDGILISYTGSESQVTIPSEVLYIGDNAFRNNTSLEKVVLGNSVMGIGNCSFYGCTSLTSVEQSQGVGAVGAYAFYGTPFLEAQKEEFVTINDILIKYNGGGSTVVLPENVRVISPYTFAYNNSITSVIIGDNVEEIGEGAFYMCKSLSSADISPNTAVIGGYAFYDTPWLENDEREFLIEGRNILIACKSESGSITIPYDVVTIGTGAFFMSGIESVTFPETVKVIGMRSFMGCENLKEVDIRDGILMIDVQAFYNCPGLEKATISSSVEVIKKEAFVKGVLVIYGDEGSEAQRFAEENGIPFNGGSVFGDVDKDGVFNISDVTAIQSYIAGVITADIDLSAADANGDGFINVDDATYLQKYLAGLI